MCMPEFVVESLCMRVSLWIRISLWNLCKCIFRACHTFFQCFLMLSRGPLPSQIFTMFMLLSRAFPQSFKFATIFTFIFTWYRGGFFTRYKGLLEQLDFQPWLQSFCNDYRVYAAKLGFLQWGRFKWLMTKAQFQTLLWWWTIITTSERKETTHFCAIDSSLPIWQENRTVLHRFDH
jgi:hypothetical protein